MQHVDVVVAVDAVDVAGVDVRSRLMMVSGVFGAAKAGLVLCRPLVDRERDCSI